MKTEIVIDRKSILAMQLLAGKDQSRYLLCGTVNFEVTNTQCVLAATDGRRLGALLDGEITDPPDKPVSLTMLVDVKMLRALPSGGDPRVRLTFEHDEHSAGTITVAPFDEKSAHIKITQALVEGTYPNWRGIMPQGVKPSPIDPNFDWRLLEGFIKIGETLRGKNCASVRVSQSSPDSVMLVQLSGVPNFIGCLMPMRASEVSHCAPAWALPPTVTLPVTAPAAA